MTVRIKKFNLVEIPYYGEIGAGSVVPFIPRHATESVFIPDDGMNIGSIAAVTIRGISLESEYIFDGDLLIFSKDFHRRDITPHTVCVVYIIPTGELVAKKVLFDHAGMITLRASGGDIKDLHFAMEDIEIKGIAIGFTRMFDKNHRVPGKFDPDFPF